MAVPQLYYFTIRGFGEYIRLLFLDNGIKFEDIRFDYEGNEWQEFKKGMLLGQLPCLKVDGQEIVQTGAIMRHLGRVHDQSSRSHRCCQCLSIGLFSIHSEATFCLEDFRITRYWSLWSGNKNGRMPDRSSAVLQNLEEK
ncbi:GST N-terminal domain-containing protein [Caenorhabditis elegans]|uniref:GST N-terminal domain-containing protein n=1 Tax=Caenorhabditis elegans TaxID=6239 RepID=A0A486WUX8_CAEEL|nr:GST N-terminal domain-containing protein [Caenorhabditis elegans]VGM69563.1 GST N-terminal domain-containing protein [Caenorhabditis elegans]